MINFTELNLPKSYVDFVSEKDPLKQFYYQYNFYEINNPKEGNFFIIYWLASLEHNGYDENEPDWKALQKMEYYKDLEGDIDDISFEDLANSFVFGIEDGWGLMFFSKSWAVYVIYSDLYARKLANSFDEFMKYAEFDSELDMRDFGWSY